MSSEWKIRQRAWFIIHILNMMKTLAILVIIAAYNYKFIVPVRAQQSGDWSNLQTTVRVINDLNPGNTFIARCRSSENDLGQHPIGNGQSFSWSFKVNIWGTTKFTCTLNFSDVQKDVIIYDAKKDDGLCAAQCMRSIRTDGAYYYHEYTKSWEKRYEW